MLLEDEAGIRKEPDFLMLCLVFQFKLRGYQANRYTSTHITTLIKKLLYVGYVRRWSVDKCY